MFCICFLHVDATWTQRNAVRTDFGKIIGTCTRNARQSQPCLPVINICILTSILYVHFFSLGELKSSLQTVLARGPRSLEDFKHIAAAEGMNVLI